jgi:N-acetyl sugar amidotransferase
MQKKIIHNNKLIRCANCTMPLSRPRMEFNDKGICNACMWTIAKKKINWKERIKILKRHLDHEKLSKQNFNVLVPVSGGKDGSYVSHMVRHKLKGIPLAVTATPPLQLDVGIQNLKNFVKSGYDLVSIDVNYQTMRKINTLGFIEIGFPYFGWLVAIHTAVLRTAINFGINLIIYGEDGEVEYGGNPENIKNPFYDHNYMKKIYLENNYKKVFNKIIFKGNEDYFFRFPKDDLLKKLKITHWSYFENWDPYRNYLVAKRFCGLQESKKNNLGTFTNFAQNDQALVALHTYLMYLKFGFGRATADACIEVRRGSMERNQAISLIKAYDGHFPKEFEEVYLDYFKMNKRKFYNILFKHTDKKLFKKIGNNIIPKIKLA